MDEQNHELIPSEAEETPAKPDLGRLYLIRILLGGYLIYLAWELLGGVLHGTAVGKVGVISGLAGGLFAIVGAGLIVWSAWLLLKRK